MTLLLLLGCTSSDYPGWRNSLDDIEAALLEDGTCPDEPPAHAAMTDGTRYAPDWRVRSEEDSWLRGDHEFLETAEEGQYTVVEVLGADEGTLINASCGLGEDFETPERGDGLVLDIESPSLTGHRTAPFFYAAPPFGGWVRMYRDGQETQWNPRDGDSYGWLCLEHAEDSPDGPHWSGAMAMHVDDDGSGDPIDAFWAFESVDCATEEDASDIVDTDGWITSGECDGLDNDFDGVVDEGASDHDGDGVPDCLPHP